MVIDENYFVTLSKTLKYNTTEIPPMGNKSSTWFYLNLAPYICKSLLEPIMIRKTRYKNCRQELVSNAGHEYSRNTEN